MQVESPPESFHRFVKETGPRLKQALIASFGRELGRETTADALGYAWEHWDRINARSRRPRCGAGSHSALVWAIRASRSL